MLPARDYMRAMRIRRQIANQVGAIAARFDALLAPTLGTVAPGIDENFEVSLRHAAAGAIGAAGNLAGLPAISVPNGLDRNGLPTAIQFVGSAFGENAIIDAAVAFQAHTAWHRARPLVG
jgi:aspartyl-tRNA(Asn)/glutamyl-tRNA(Gln) amidotransferase subunit A